MLSVLQMESPARDTAATEDPHPEVVCAAALPLPCLSLELVASIVDHLHDDPSTLKACALVCRAFLPHARAALFRTVSLHVRSSEKFLVLLQRAPSLGVYVRTLHVLISAFEGQRTWVDRILPTLAPLLPNVGELKLKGNKGAVYRAKPLLGLKGVRKLSVTGCELESLEDFCALMGLLPALESVTASDLFMYRCAEITTRVPKPYPGFTRITMNSCKLDPFMLVDWMLQEKVGMNLEYLACCPTQARGLEPLSQLLKEAGWSMKHLKLGLVGLAVQGGFVATLEEHPSLAYCPNLRTLELCSPAAFGDMFGTDDISFGWMPLLLSQVISPIKTVKFHLWEGDAEGVQSVAWDQIAQLLASEQYRTMTRLQVHIWGSPKETLPMKKRIRELFASFDGVLQIDDQPDPACCI